MKVKKFPTDISQLISKLTFCLTPWFPGWPLPPTKACSCALLMCWGLILPSLFPLSLKGLLSSQLPSGRWHSHCLASMYSMWPSPLACTLALKPVRVYISHRQGEARYISVNLLVRGLLFTQWDLRESSQGKQCHVVESQDHSEICLMSDVWSRHFPREMWGALLM